MKCMEWMHGAIWRTVRRSDITQPVPVHTFRNPLTTSLIEAGDDMGTVRELLRHKDVRTKMIDTHVLNRGGRGVLSPLDRLSESENGPGARINTTNESC